MTPTVDVSEFTPDRIADLVLLVNVLDNRVRSQSAEIAGLRAKVEQLEALSAQLTEDYGQLAAATLPVHDHGEPVG